MPKLKNKLSIHEILESYWGFKNFRPMQEEVIQEVLNKKDCLALLPTGGGKSICYQVPALAMEGTCIVISPLVALMKDQVAQLQERRIKAIAITGGMSANELDIALDNCVYGRVKLLYLSPERLHSDLVLERIQKMKISFIAVDEAHCISQWGYDFRPSYLQIAEIRELLPDKAILALSATATITVAKDIQDQLHFKNHNLKQKSFLRPKLSYMVLEESRKMNRLFSMLRKIQGSAIIYVRSRKRAVEISKELQAEGFSALHYHAGLSREQRDQNQDEWMKNRARIMVATNAFGMGIDKADVRLVVHQQIPDTLESYFQEAGRAGRDENKAFAVALYHESDLISARDRFIDNYPNAKDVRTIYQKLADHLQVAIGDGFEESFSFNLEAFCNNYKLNPSKTLKALHIYEKEALIKYEDFDNSLSTIHIICSSAQVMNYQSQNKKKEALLQLILRLYPGVFDQACDFRERKLALKLEQSSIYVHKLLGQLHQERVINYESRNNSGKILFTSARHDSKKLPISNSHFEERKSLLFDKLNKVHEYIRNTEYCRSRLLVDYFGEQLEQDCNCCDICIKKQSEGAEQKQKIQEDLFSLLSMNPTNISTFVARYSKLQEQSVLDLIKALLEEEIIIKKGSTLHLNEQR